MFSDYLLCWPEQGMLGGLPVRTKLQPTVQYVLGYPCVSLPACLPRSSCRITVEIETRQQWEYNRDSLAYDTNTHNNYLKSASASKKFDSRFRSPIIRHPQCWIYG
jgi:hypothetical protein